MPTATIRNSELHSEVKNLRREVVQLRSVVIGLLGEDSDGKYRPEFVRQVLAAAREVPSREFSTPSDFLKILSRA